MVYDVQKAGILKRASAFLLDIIVIAIIATGVAYLMSFVLNLDYHQDKLQSRYTYYEKEYGVRFDLTQEDFNNMSEEELKKYDDVQKLINKDDELIQEYRTVITDLLIIVFVSGLVSIMISEFFIPLLFKNGQTIGKKVFSLVVIRNNSVRANTVQLFARALLGKFAVETMIPAYLIVMSIMGSMGIIGPIILGLFLIFQIILFFATKNRTFIHDILSYTVVADNQAQLIFETDEDLLKYKQKIHNEYVEKQDY